MELWQIDYFLGVVKHGTTMAAAEALHVSQSSISAGLHALELDLGCQLFDRKGRRLVLNDNGRFFAERARTAKGLLDDSERTLREKTERGRNTVNCALRTPVGNLGVLMRGFASKFPEYSLRIGFVESGSFSVFGDEVPDIELFSTPLEVDEDHVVKLCWEEYVLCLPPNHQFSCLPVVGLADCRDMPFVFSVGGKQISCMDPLELCAQAGFAPKTVCEVQHISDAMNLVECGIGCCIAAEKTWLANQRYQVAVRPIADVKRGRNVYARLLRGGSSIPAAWAFAEYLQEYAKQI